MHNIILYPDPILREKSEIIRLPLSEEDKKLLKEMYAFVKDPANEAVGLSAVQVGVLKRMCIVQTSEGLLKLVNPRIIWHSTEKQYDSEGCLSVKGSYVSDQLIPRWEKIRITAYDAVQNKNVIMEFKGFSAVVVQHELDHMDGVLYIDYVNKEEGQ